MDCSNLTANQIDAIARHLASLDCQAVKKTVEQNCQGQEGNDQVIPGGKSELIKEIFQENQMTNEKEILQVFYQKQVKLFKILIQRMMSEKVNSESISGKIAKDNQDLKNPYKRVMDQLGKDNESLNKKEDSRKALFMRLLE